MIFYGIKYYVKKIEKLCYMRDLLFNVEWNQKKDREVYFYCYFVFFGWVEDVVNDCCGFCFVLIMDQEKEIVVEEEKYFVLGKIFFFKDDLGRQVIGLFNFLMDDDWIEMVYVGNMVWFCQVIVDGDVEYVKDWFVQEGVDFNIWDYIGCIFLYFVVMMFMLEIVCFFVDVGVRFVVCFVDGWMVFYFVVLCGSVEIVQIFMNKSVVNEVEYEEKEEKCKKEFVVNKIEEDKMDVDEKEEDGSEKEEDEEFDGEMIDGEDFDDEGWIIISGFVKVGKDVVVVDELVLEEVEEEFDFYDVNVIVWDIFCFVFYFVIMEGYCEVVKILCQVCYVGF